MSFRVQIIVNSTFGASEVFHMKGQIGSQRDIKAKISHMNTSLFKKKQK
jgi:hypothetical protein